MKNYFVKKSSLKGEITIPPSKSQTMRAILFASIAKGRSKIKNFLKSDDVFSFIEGCRKFKAKIFIKKNNLEIIGINKKILLKENEKVNVNNSGIALRFLTSIYALSNKKIILTGDKSILENRSMKPLIEALNFLKADVRSLKNNGFAPLEVKGPILSRKVKISGQDSQYVSSLLIASALLKDEMQIEVKDLKEKPWVNLTLNRLDKFKVKYHKPGLKLSAATTGKLKKYGWPGNIRELKNSIERAVILESKAQLTAESIFPPAHEFSSNGSAKSYDLVENEKRLILEVIQKNRGNMTNTAKDLGIERTALYRRLKKYGL